MSFDDLSTLLTDKDTTYILPTAGGVASFADSDDVVRDDRLVLMVMGPLAIRYELILEPACTYRVRMVYDA